MAAGKTESRTDAATEGAGASPTTPSSVPLVGRVRERVTQELNARKERASEVIQGVAGAVRRVGEPLHQESLQALGAYADEAANRLDRLASGLRDRDVAELADDVRRMARENPTVFAAVGFAAGFAAARFLKTTAPDKPRHAHRGVAAERAVPRATRARGRFDDDNDNDNA